jgi:hypothetical protein
VDLAQAPRAFARKQAAEFELNNCLCNCRQLNNDSKSVLLPWSAAQGRVRLGGN